MNDFFAFVLTPYVLLSFGAFILCLLATIILLYCYYRKYCGFSVAKGALKPYQYDTNADDAPNENRRDI